SLFICGRPSFPAKLTIESVPPSVATGGSVLLLVHNLPEYLQLFFSYKGVILFNNKVEIARPRPAKNLSDPGPAHSGRETVYSNGSLLLQNVTWKEGGFYTLQTLNRYWKIELTYIYLQVDTPCCDTPDSAQLMIHPVTCHGAEGGSVLLQVHYLPEDVQTFSWFKGVDSTPSFKIVEYSKGMKSMFIGSAHSRRETGHINGSLLLQDATEKDTGLYTLLTIDSYLKVETVRAQVNCWGRPVALMFELEPPRHLGAERKGN
ncbi:pregnancy-specific glycoprotein 22-like, partial [Mus caroli]|uniref:Pregnancy-specific glycoprotein 22-like n=1 Tax=Mus caroli TaxID=10089 RepID=A0A6P5P7L5_MUSCR